MTGGRNPSSRKSWEGLGPYAYLVRAVILIVLLELYIRSFIVYLFESEFAVGPTLLQIVGELDLLRSLFYAVLPACLIVGLAPAPRGGKARSPGLTLTAGLALGALCVVPIFLAPGWSRPTATAGLGVVLTCCYVFANVSGLIWFHSGGNWSKRLRKLTVLAVGLSDILFPALLWSAHRKRFSIVSCISRLVPCAMVFIVPMLPWIFSPLGLDEPPKTSAGLDRVIGGNYYQVLVDPAGGALICTDADDTIARIDPDRSQDYLRAKLEASYTLSVALDRESGKLIYVDPKAGYSFVLDSESLGMERRLPLDRAFEKLHNCRTLWNGDRGLLASLCYHGAMLVCPDGRHPIAKRDAVALVDGVYDRERDELHVLLLSPYALVALDARTLEIKHWLELPHVPERVVMDSVNDRLIVSLPILGRLLVVDAVEYRETGTGRAFPGVRDMAVDTETRRIYLVGLSPFLEVRSLEDFSLIDRLSSPCWARWITLDRDRNRAYIATAPHGIWSVDLFAVGKNSAFWKKVDPFHNIASLGSGMLGRHIISTHGHMTGPPDLRFSLLREAPCPESLWHTPDEAVAPSTEGVP